jgi:hypothetical protein
MQAEEQYSSQRPDQPDIFLVPLLYSTVHLVYVFQKIEAKPTLLIQELKKIEAKRAWLVPEIKKIEGNQTLLIQEQKEANSASSKY